MPREISRNGGLSRKVHPWTIGQDTALGWVKVERCKFDLDPRSPGGVVEYKASVSGQACAWWWRHTPMWRLSVRVGWRSTATHAATCTRFESNDINWDEMVSNRQRVSGNFLGLQEVWSPPLRPPRNSSGIGSQAVRDYLEKGIGHGSSEITEATKASSALQFGCDLQEGCWHVSGVLNWWP